MIPQVGSVKEVCIEPRKFSLVLSLMVTDQLRLELQCQRRRRGRERKSFSKLHVLNLAVSRATSPSQTFTSASSCVRSGGTTTVPCAARCSKFWWEVIESRFAGQVSFPLLIGSTSWALIPTLALSSGRLPSDWHGKERRTSSPKSHSVSFLSMPR